VFEGRDSEALQASAQRAVEVEVRFSGEEAASPLPTNYRRSGGVLAHFQACRRHLIEAVFVTRTALL